MSPPIVVVSDDLETGIRYALHLSEDQACELLDAHPGAVMAIGPKGWWIQVHEKTLLVRQGSNPTLLDKAGVLRKIQDALP